MYRLTSSATIKLLKYPLMQYAYEPLETNTLEIKASESCEVRIYCVYAALSRQPSILMVEPGIFRLVAAPIRKLWPA